MDQEIAERLGTTPRAVNGKRQRLGLVTPLETGAAKVMQVEEKTDG
jgi:hypothetical protein